MSDDAKPIWLDLKKEYVDDNFDALVTYLNNNRQVTDDPFYATTLRLLRERVHDLIDQISSRPLYSENVPQEDLEFHVRLLGCYLLTYPQANDRIPALLALLHELRILVPNCADGIINLVSKCLGNRGVAKVPFSYNDLAPFKKDIFAFRLCRADGVVFSNPAEVPAYYENKGCIWQTESGLTMAAPGAWPTGTLPDNLVSSLDTNAGCRFATPRGTQLRNTTQIAEVSNFSEQFMLDQGLPLKKTKKTLHGYSNGDKAVFTVSHIADGQIYLESVDPAYKKLSGQAVFSQPLLCGFQTDTLWKFVYVGDKINATVRDAENGVISFESELKEFLVESMRDEYPVGSEVFAKLKLKGKFYIWLSESGVSVTTFPVDDYEIGDMARLGILRYEDRNNYGKINCEIIAPATDEEFIEEYKEGFDDQRFRKEAIEAFVDSTVVPEYTKGQETRTVDFDVCLMPLVIRIFYTHQRTLPRPGERFRFLANAMALSRLIDDTLSLDFLRFSASYLRAIVSFASNDNIHDIELRNFEAFADSEAVVTRREVLDILKEYGTGEYSEKLQNAINEYADSNPIISKLARLIQAANSIRDTLTPSTLNTLKREIVKNLSIETEEDVLIDSYGAQYLGIESQTVEFKTSMVYPPDNNMRPNQALQTHNVMKAICGFLNSSIGGTVYVGVNDQGYVSGLQDDFAYLHAQSFDSYVRLTIFDKCVSAFGKEVMNYIHIEPAFNEKVAMIRVDPFPFGVIELDKKAYLRVDRETREMTAAVRAQVSLQKFRKDLDTASAIDQLRQARFSKRRAILHGYASSNSGTISDRLVEVFDVLEADGIVCCIDCADRERKTFKVSRVNYVEITDEECQDAHLYAPMEIDSMLFTGKEKADVSLRLDMYARNLLVEEFPRTVKKVVHDGKDTDSWYYTDSLFPAGIDTLARIYVSNADHIEILDAPEVEKQARTYLDKVSSLLN